VKVLDFGLVKFNDTASMQQTLATADHPTTGTPAFMAPEVILGGKEVDPRADVYAVGCVTYFLLTGELVFDADTPMKMFLHHVQTPPVPPAQRAEVPIPPALNDLVMACLEKDPDRRAQRWWEKHLIDLTGPLPAPERPADVAERAVVIN